jgi:hypothetical protein
MEGQPKSFSGHQVKRILRIAENNPDRANKVLDRMKERKGLAGDTKITKYGQKTLFASGFTALQNIAFDAVGFPNGYLYVLDLRLWFKLNRLRLPPC